MNYQNIQISQGSGHVLIVRDSLSNSMVSAKQKTQSHLSEIQQHHTYHLAQSQLKNTVKSVKTNILVRRFINKLKRLVIHKQKIPENLQKIQQNLNMHLQNSDLTDSSLQVSPQLRIIGLCSQMIITVTLLILTSLKVTFVEIDPIQSILLYLKIIYIGILLIQIGLTLVNLKKIIDFRSIITKGDNLQNLSSILLLLVTFFGYQMASAGNILLLLSQIYQINRGIRIRLNQMIFSASFDRIWTLIKIILFNFLIAHLISIVLNLMTRQRTQNWYYIKGIQNSMWYTKYIWGYYWGTTIMLTVGFGDLAATNTYQALCLIFIQTFSCIILAYNITSVSRILTQASQFDNLRNFKQKIFNQMCTKYKVTDQFRKKVNIFIDKSLALQSKMNDKKQQMLIAQFPVNLKLQLHKQINLPVLNSLPFFKNLRIKALISLAERISKVLAQPEEIIAKRNSQWDVYILRMGNIDFLYSKDRCSMNGNTIQSCEIQNGVDKPRLLSLKFLRNKVLDCDLKSTTFSLLNILTIAQFKDALRKHQPTMFEYFCSLRDQMQDITQHNECFKCSFCLQSFHSLFDCPKIHYFPLRSLIIRKRLFENHYPVNFTQKTVFLRKRQGTRFNALRFYKKLTKKAYLQDKNKPGSFQNVGNNRFSFSAYMMTQKEQMNSKIDKCQNTVQTILRVVKGQKQATQIDLDIAADFIQYFPTSNSQSLISLMLKTNLSRDKN